MAEELRQNQFLLLPVCRVQTASLFNTYQRRRLANSREHHHIHQFGGIERAHGKQADQCADTFGAVLTKWAVFAYNDVLFQPGYHFLFQVIHLSFLGKLGVG
jgi:hypothetical protein